MGGSVWPHPNLGIPGFRRVEDTEITLVGCVVENTICRHTEYGRREDPISMYNHIEIKI